MGKWRKDKKNGALDKVRDMEKPGSKPQLFSCKDIESFQIYSIKKGKGLIRGDSGRMCLQYVIKTESNGVLNETVSQITKSLT